MVIVYITCRSRKEAEKISAHLLNQKLIACANIFPVKSMYWWSSRIVHENENVIIAKTNEKKFNKVVSEAKKLHSYKIPCILRIEAKANRDFEAWANTEMK